MPLMNRSRLGRARLPLRRGRARKIGLRAPMFDFAIVGSGADGTG